MGCYPTLAFRDPDQLEPEGDTELLLIFTVAIPVRPAMIEQLFDPESQICVAFTSKTGDCLPLGRDK
tara:strand:- start:1506 stop:1706 length:201 start_codon:yes stop_codon:yes gene_type:complete